MKRSRLFVVALLAVLSLEALAWGTDSRRASLAIRGVPQILYLYDAQNRKLDASAVIVVSGDGGWHGFIVEVAQYFADHGYPAIGVDAKEYLSTMSRPKALEPAQVSGDFAAIAQFAKQQTGAKSLVLAGWSEGAGLAVLGGLDPGVRSDLRGVVAMGLPQLNELAWRWSDSVIYVTKKVPSEPTFNSKDYVGKLAPVPLMSIQSTQDDFVPTEAAREIFARAQEPKQIIFIGARNHRFEGERPAFWQALDRALAWFDTLAAQSPR